MCVLTNRLWNMNTVQEVSSSSVEDDLIEIARIVDASMAANGEDFIRG